jgi:hypothetical protein
MVVVLWSKGMTLSALKGECQWHVCCMAVKQLWFNSLMRCCAVDRIMMRSAGAG